MKNTTDVKVKVEFTEGYEDRYTKACLKQLERRSRKQKESPGNMGNKMDAKGIA